MNKNYYVKTTSGRSMIEIIAVLAIMAVLSIGAIAGLRYALDKIKANRIMKEALTQAVEIKGRKAQKDSNEVKYAYAKNARYVTLRSYETDPNATDPSKKKLLVLKAPNISKGVCRKLVVHDNQKMYNPIFISILTADKSTTCLNSNTIVFTVGDIPVEADPFECHLTAADCPNGNFSKKSCSCICDALGCGGKAFGITTSFAKVLICFAKTRGRIITFWCCDRALATAIAARDKRGVTNT